MGTHIAFPAIVSAQSGWLQQTAKVLKGNSMFLIGPLYHLGDAFAFLTLSAIGLAVIFGMMGVINLAQGAFMMVGAYGTAASVHHGAPLVVGMLVGIILATLLGIIVERLVVRHLYNRPLDTLLATWAISVLVVQGTKLILGPTFPSIATPLGSVSVGGQSFPVYRILLIILAFIVLGGLHSVLTYTRLGMDARATIQDPNMARALGIRTDYVYSFTFAVGAGLGGLTGALYAPTMALVPGMGAGFIIQAFATVIVGGGDLLFGLLPGAGALGLIQSSLTGIAGTLIGEVGLLAAVILVARVLPNGFAGWLAGAR